MGHGIKRFVLFQQDGLAWPDHSPRHSQTAISAQVVIDLRAGAYIAFDKSPAPK